MDFRTKRGRQIKGYFNNSDERSLHKLGWQQWKQKEIEGNDELRHSRTKKADQWIEYRIRGKEKN